MSEKVTRVVNGELKEFTVRDLNTGVTAAEEQLQARIAKSMQDDKPSPYDNLSGVVFDNLPRDSQKLSERIMDGSLKGKKLARATILLEASLDEEAEAVEDEKQWKDYDKAIDASTGDVSSWSDDEPQDGETYPPYPEAGRKAMQKLGIWRQ